MATSQTPLGYKITDKGVILGYQPEFDDDRQAPGYPKGVTIGMVKKAQGSSVSIPLGNGQYVTLYGEAADAYNSGQLTKDQAKEIANRIISKDYDYEPEPNPYTSLANAFLSQMQALMSQQSEYIRRLEEQARRQAEAIARQKINSLQALIDQLKTSQEVGLMDIANAVKNAEMSLEDRYFQNWLAARQAMANRGLAGSGIASDQDTRLLLQRQRDLADIYAQAERNRYDLISRIGQQLDQAYRELADINVEDIYADRFAQLYQAGRQELMDQARLYADLFKTILPYERMTLRDYMEWQGSPIDWAKWYGSPIDWAKLALDYDYNFARLDLDKQRLALDKAKQLLDERKIDLEYWKALGYMPAPDGSGKLVPTAQTSQFEREMALREAEARGYFIGPNGEIIPTETRRHNEAIETLRGEELKAQIVHWAEQNRIAAQRVALDAAQFEWKAKMDQETLKKIGAELQLQADKNELSRLQAMLDSVDSQIKAVLAQDPTLPANRNSPYYELYQALIQQRNQVWTELSTLFKKSTFRSNSQGLSKAWLSSVPE